MRQALLVSGAGNKSEEDMVLALKEFAVQQGEAAGLL